jgi:hypothetical protein
MPSKVTFSGLTTFAGRTKTKFNSYYVSALIKLASAAQTPQPSVKVTGGSFEYGKIPVDTGRLRESFTVYINGRVAAQGSEAHLSALPSVKVGDQVTLGWTAPYSDAVEYGTPSMDGRFFATAAAERWPEFLREARKKVSR